MIDIFLLRIVIELRGAGWRRGEGAGRRARGRAGKRRSGFGMMTSRGQGQYSPGQDKIIILAGNIFNQSKKIHTYTYMLP